MNNTALHDNVTKEINKIKQEKLLQLEKEAQLATMLPAALDCYFAVGTLSRPASSVDEHYMVILKVDTRKDAVDAYHEFQRSFGAVSDMFCAREHGLTPVCRAIFEYDPKVSYTDDEDILPFTYHVTSYSHTHYKTEARVSWSHLITSPSGKRQAVHVWCKIERDPSTCEVTGWQGMAHRSAPCHFRYNGLPDKQGTRIQYGSGSSDTPGSCTVYYLPGDDDSIETRLEIS